MQAAKDFGSFNWSVEGFTGGKEPAHDGTVKICDEEGRLTEGGQFWVEVKHQKRLKKSQHGDFISHVIDEADVEEWSRSRSPSFLVIYEVPHELPYEVVVPGFFQFVSWVPRRRSGRQLTLRIPIHSLLDFPLGKERIELIVSKLDYNRDYGWNLEKRREKFEESNDWIGVGAVLMALGDINGAANTILNAKGKTYEHFLAFSVSANIFTQRAELGKSEQVFSKAIRCEVNDAKKVEALIGWSHALRTLGKDQEAEAVINRQLQKNLDTKKRGVLLYHMGLIEHRRSN